MKEYSYDISIIIVNYNVKAFLSNLLHSIDRARNELRIEVLIVDNASVDGSPEFITSRHPNVTYIYNEKNVGFGTANNQAIKKATGKYALIINPDTIISENTLQVMFNHMEKNSRTGAAGCKLLNPDGSFAPESRRQVPTPAIALWKMTGLTKLFPKSKRFAGYYMNWLDEDEPSKVPVLSGSFMFYRTDVLKELGGFDEQFFMYGEDIDLCYRTTQSGWEIDYVPDTSIIHYKGESTKKENIDYHITFNKANYIFFQKHFSPGYSFVFRIIIFSGIIGRGVFSYLQSLLVQSAPVIRDLLVINLVIFFGFLFRYDIGIDTILADYEPRYFLINVLASVLFLISVTYFDVYQKAKFHYIPLIKTVLLTFFGIALITFFIRELAFSRLILGAGSIISILVLVIFRAISIRKNRKKNPLNQFLPLRVIIVGDGEKTDALIKKIKSRVEWNYEIIGTVTKNEKSSIKLSDTPVIGNLNQLPDLIRFYDADEVLYLLPSVSYEEILQVISQIRNPDVSNKIVPDSLDYVIGKTNVDYLDEFPVMDVEIAYRATWNKFVKRSFDLACSLILLIFLFLPGQIQTFRHRKKMNFFSFYISATNRTELRFSKVADTPFLNFYNALWHILKGEMSFVGAPLIPEQKPTISFYTYGITGLRQINEKRTLGTEEQRRFELYYLQNYSIWLDMEIILKSIQKGTAAFSYLYDAPSGSK